MNVVSCSNASRRRLLVPVVAIALMAGCTGTSAEPSEDVTTVAEGLESPWSIAFYGQTPLVSERDTARIVELDGEGTAREIAVVDDAAPSGEGGVLGIAVHDDYVFVYYTTHSDNRIVRYPLEGDAGSLALGPGETILEGIPAASHHNGGRIAFGPDGMLYATTRDAGETIAAQDLDSLAGKILRMAPDGATPEGNPFKGSVIYSFGHRNPQGIAWDEAGTMWPEVEGVAEDSRYTDPVQQWKPAEASPSGIAITEGSIYIANLRGARLREVPLDDLGASAEHLVGEYGRLRDVVLAPDGSLWVMMNNTDGRGEPGPGDDHILRMASAS